MESKEIKVGEYVRTDNGIGKVVPKANGWVTNEQVTLDLYNGIKNISIFKDIIKSHSKNIIDLIEVGDIVRVLDHEWDRIFNLYDEDILESFIEDTNENNWELKSIVTKEQFKSIEYRLED